MGSFLCTGCLRARNYKQVSGLASYTILHGQFLVCGALKSQELQNATLRIGILPEGGRGVLRFVLPAVAGLAKRLDLSPAVPLVKGSREHCYAKT